ncbi:uncharacterized protein DDB_G0283357-like [Microplitis mediator]|uniref:uncharacterized protein DDB_G0283357-like n=1 Tax=Microplitis mediator TaxID=375433 RepID=UPI0025542A5E|nr:uncharacterized protein DDB_G0283357-like [Microplitis mediator]
MRFAIFCLMAATAVSVSGVNSKRYSFYLDQSPSTQNTHALAGQGDNNAHNRAIVNDIQLNTITNEDGSGNNGPSGVYNGNTPLYQRVVADAGQGKNNYDNAALARGYQDNTINNINRPENPSGIDVPNSPTYQEAIARVANGDNLAVANAEQNNSLYNKNKSYINAPNSPLYQRATAEAEGTGNDSRPRLAVANVYQNNTQTNGSDRRPMSQKGTTVAGGYGNFKSKATVNNKQD